VIEPEHILLGLLDVAEGTASKILRSVGIDISKLRTELTS
jgi:ATP-dependent Clp protease ATP-binding subunit ClpA